MHLNKGKRDILIFPKFKNLSKIQEIRNKYDPLANLVAPHITIAFPFSDNMSNEELIRKLSKLLEDFKPFTVVFRGISLSKDNYIFLNCIYGNRKITQLHDKIYEHILLSHLKDSTKYIPHITLGKANSIQNIDLSDCEFKTVVDEVAIELIGENEESIIIAKIRIWKKVIIMVHKMKLQESPFEKIKNGTKTIEFRLYDEKRSKIKKVTKLNFLNCLIYRKLFL